MLNRPNWPTATRTPDPPLRIPEEPTIDLVEAFRLLRRRWVSIASILGVTISACAVYLATTPPRYTASSLLLFGIRTAHPFQQQQLYQTVDSAYVDGQVEVLKSEHIARSVVTSLNLLSDPEFILPGRGLLSDVIAILGATLRTDKHSMGSDPLGPAIGVFKANLEIKRLGLTYLIQINYRSLDADKAARITNAVTEVHIARQAETKYRAVHNSNLWLEDSINELKTKAQNAERAVAEYKARNNIVDTGAPLLNDRQLAELFSERRVILKDLESAAQTSRALYETFLQRVAEANQQQSFPTTEAQVISAASPPLTKSEPKAVLILGAGILLGLVGGVGVAFAREYFDDALRSSVQVEKKLGINCLGILPTISRDKAIGEKLRQRRWLALPEWRSHIGRNPFQEDGDPSKQHAMRDDRVIATTVGQYWFVVVEPFSSFAETIRSLKVALEIAGLNGRNKVIGVTSALPCEGKSVVAANLSEMVALSGSKVLLIDGDLRNRGLTQRFAPAAKVGLTGAIAGHTAVKDLVWRDPLTNMDFLPAVLPAGAAPPFGIVSLAAMHKLLHSVQDHYDHVILDLPPITPVADVKAASYLVDYFILVIEWGRTSPEAVMNALNSAPLVSEKLLGAVMNKANPTELKK